MRAAARMGAVSETGTARAAKAGRTRPELRRGRVAQRYEHRSVSRLEYGRCRPRACRFYSQTVRYRTALLTAQTWVDFAGLVEAHNGVWGGCWCMGLHPEGVGPGHTAEGNREAKRAHTMAGTVHQVLVYTDDECV